MVDRVFCEGIRTAGLTRVAFLTVGSFASFAEGLTPRAVEAADALEASFPREVVVFETTFFTLALMDLGFSNLRFLPWRADGGSFASTRFRFVLSAFLGPPMASNFAR